MKSLEELKRIKEQTLKAMDLRQAKERGKVVVAMGTCGIAAGAKDALMAVIEELEKADIHDVQVVQSGCMGLCDREPTVEVSMKDQPSVIYGDVDEANARRIVREHIQGGQVVAELVIKRGNI
ncbi:MAG: (2Fe-2S) ferredoxin domain-containing protein [Caldiserica bacterium]|nr:(2Fe-2S) ferredoxin domain-containing protein [Caldisericota bacterium]